MIKSNLQAICRKQSSRFVPGIQVQWAGNGTLWGTRGYDILASSDDGQNWKKITTIPVQGLNRLLVKSGNIRRLLRLDIRGYLQRSDEELVVFCNGNIYRWQKGDPTPTKIGELRRGRAPLQQGCCVDDHGNLYYGEYWRNSDREEVNIYIRRKGTSWWDLFYSFPKRAIRHVHAVQFDPHSGKIWVATGDHDQESKIGFFETSPYGSQFKVVASGSQMSRAVSLLFTRDYVYWGSDGGRGTTVRANHIYRWSRTSMSIEAVAEIGGPAYFSTVDSVDRLFVSTGVEGSASEHDSCARVWMSVDGCEWRELGRWEKDTWPFLFGYGLLSFPQGITSKSRLYVVGNGIRKGAGTWVLDLTSTEN